MILVWLFVSLKKRNLINLRWGVVADQIDSFGPDHSPNIHVVAHIDGTADTITSGPHQLKEKHTIKGKRLVIPPSFSKLVEKPCKNPLPECSECTQVLNI